MTRADGLRKLERLADRLGIPKRAVRVRPISGTRAIELCIEYRGVSLQRTCGSQPTVDGNFVCLVLWLQDLVRNVERRIETMREAFFAEGGRLLPEHTGDYGAMPKSLYRGERTIEDARDIIGAALRRLGREERDVRVSWDESGARLVLRLPSGRVMEKSCVGQLDTRSNVVALALWLQTRAKNFERGIETDLDALFAANLLGAGS